MTANIFHDVPYGDIANFQDVHNGDLISDMRTEAFGPPSFLAANFPWDTDGDLNPWRMHHFGWNGELAPISKHGPEEWNLANVGMNYKEEEIGELAICAYAQAGSGNSVPPWDGSRDTVTSQLATERALFMTPSAYPPSFSTFPGSPISDLSSTPDMSHPGLWETDYDRSSLPATTETYRQAMKHESQETAPGHLSGTDEDDYPTTLEMPDGSTRRTSNWLPVDPRAGFTIGSHAVPSYTQFDCMEDLQKAFISPDTAGWTYDG